MAYVKIRPRRGTKDAWEYANPILSEGEVGYEVPDTGVGTGYINQKMGDGVTPWSSLPYSINMATTLETVGNLLTQVNNLNTTVVNMGRTVEKVENKTSETRKILIQEAEPTADNLLGEIWIQTDMMTGDMRLSIDETALEVGTDFTITAAVTLAPEVDRIDWSTSDQYVVAIEQKSEMPNNAYCKIIAMTGGTAVITAKAIYGGNVVVQLSCLVTAIQSGSMELSPSLLRLITGHQGNLTLTMRDGLKYDDLEWQSSAPAIAQITEQSAAGCRIRALKPDGEATIYVRDIFNGSVIFTTTARVTTVGMNISSSSLEMTAGQNAQLNVTNSMVLNSDYDTITWATSNPDVADITSQSNSGCIVVSGIAGNAVITCTASLNGVAIQTLQCQVVVKGEFYITENIHTEPVGNRFSLTLRNSLGIGNFDTVTWSSNANEIVNVESFSTSAAIFHVLAAGSAIVTAVATLNGVQVATANCTIIAEGSLRINDDTPTSLTVGITRDIYATNTMEAGSSYRVEWTSSDNTVLRAVYSGLTCTLTALKVGSAQITVRAIDENNQVAASNSIWISATSPQTGTFEVDPTNATISIGDVLTLNLNNTWPDMSLYAIEWAENDSYGTAYNPVVITTGNNTQANVSAVTGGNAVINVYLVDANDHSDIKDFSACHITVRGNVEFIDPPTSYIYDPTVIDPEDPDAVNPNEHTLAVANRFDPNSYSGYEWTSSDNNIINILNGNGSTATIEVIGAGVVDITCQVIDDNNNVVGTAVCTISVSI